MQRVISSAIRVMAPSVILAMALTIMLAGSAGAETTGENWIKYRHAVMSSMAGHAEALAMLSFGQVDKPEFAASHASALANAAAELPVLFPTGSGEGETEALPLIWEDRAKFDEAVEEAVNATAALNEAVAGGDKKAVAGAFKTVGAACKGCHENFRAEHDH